MPISKKLVILKAMKPLLDSQLASRKDHLFLEEDIREINEHDFLYAFVIMVICAIQLIGFISFMLTPLFVTPHWDRPTVYEKYYDPSVDLSKLEP